MGINAATQELSSQARLSTPFWEFHSFDSVSKLDNLRVLSTPFWEFLCLGILCRGSGLGSLFLLPFGSFPSQMSLTSPRFCRYLSTPFWEFLMEEVMKLGDNATVLSTPFWEFLDPILCCRSWQTSVDAFYSLLGVSVEHIKKLGYKVSEAFYSLLGVSSNSLFRHNSKTSTFYSLLGVSLCKKDIYTTSTETQYLSTPFWEFPDSITLSTHL